jgi:uncharacterized protein YbjT (DUF2867 family)
VRSCPVSDDAQVTGDNQQEEDVGLDGTRVLAFGTAGAQGSGLVAAITARGATAVRATSRPPQAQVWRAAGQDAVVADLTDAAAVLRAAQGVDAAALHLPLGLSSASAAAAVLASVRALRGAGLPVSVNLGTPVPGPGAPDPFGVRSTAAAVLDTGAVALTPTTYLENHAAPWALGPIARGELVYPRPAGDVLAWIAAADLGAAAAAALDAGIGAELLALAGPAPLTFDELAAEIGAGLGRPLVFRRVGAAEYGALLRPVLGGAAAAGVAAAYAAMPEGSNPLMAPDADAVWARLGVRPTPARTWAASVLAPALRGAA